MQSFSVATFLFTLLCGLLIGPPLPTGGTWVFPMAPSIPRNTLLAQVYLRVAWQLLPQRKSMSSSSFAQITVCIVVTYSKLNALALSCADQPWNSSHWDIYQQPMRHGIRMCPGPHWAMSLWGLHMRSSVGLVMRFVDTTDNVDS